MSVLSIGLLSIGFWLLSLLFTRLFRLLDVTEEEEEEQGDEDEEAFIAGNKVSALLH